MPAPAAASSAWRALAVALGGATGSLLRWRLSVWLNPWVGGPFAAGTLIVNCLGGALIGLSLVWFERQPNEVLRLLLVIGLLGGLTTFSAFSAESLGLLLRGQAWLAVLHTLAHVLGALGCAALGWWLGRLLLT